MRYFYDCEFIEDGTTIELVSIGMVGEDGREFYAVSTEFDPERAGKWVRANLSSVQLLSYFTGYAEHVALRDEARQRRGADFDERTYHDSVLAHGSPPAKYVRALLFDLPIE